MEQSAPQRRRPFVSLREAAYECLNVPHDLGEKDASLLDAGLLAQLGSLESWSDVKRLLYEEAPGFLPEEAPIDTLPPVRTNRAHPLGGGAVDDWLASVTDSEKLAATCKLSNNMLAYNLLMGRGLPPNFRFRDLGAALKDLGAQLLEWPESTVGTIPRAEKVENLPRMAADDVLRSIKGKLATTATLLSRFVIVPMVSAYTGVSVFERERILYLRIDNAEFRLGTNFVPDNATAREILRHWERTGGGRFELYELSEVEEECIPMLMGLIQYRNSAGIHRFSVTTPPLSTSKMVPPVFNALTDATELVAKFQTYLEGWTPPSQFGPDHVPLFAEICRGIKVNWDELTLQYARDKYLEYFEMCMATHDAPGGVPEGTIDRVSVIERADKLLTRAARGGTGTSEDLINAFKTPDAKVGLYTLTAEPKEVMERLNATRNGIRNVYDQREKLFRGNTYPGLAFASPDGVSTEMKIREALYRIYSLRPAHKTKPHVLMGVGYTLAMQAAFPENTIYCDITKPKHVAKNVPLIIANALNLRCEDGTQLDIAGKVYVSDVWGPQPALHYQQVDAIVAGRPAAGIMKCFLDTPATILAAVKKLSRNYATVFYCGVTKAHTGEFFICFTDLKPVESELNRGTEAQFSVFMALHSARTDMANYFYSGHVRAGVFDFTKFKRIDAVIQRHGAKIVGKVWARLVPFGEHDHAMGRKERAGAVAPTESMSLAEMEALEKQAEDTSLEMAQEEASGDVQGKGKERVTSGTDLGPDGSEPRPSPGDEEAEAPLSPSYGARQHGKGTARPPPSGRRSGQ